MAKDANSQFSRLPSYGRVVLVSMALGVFIAAIVQSAELSGIV